MFSGFRYLNPILTWLYLTDVIKKESFSCSTVGLISFVSQAEFIFFPIQGEPQHSTGWENTPGIASQTACRQSIAGSFRDKRIMK
jgi:hypothetical protein